ncbi:XdhC family protein [Rhodococcus opacus]|uniref:XdhC family protein n=1 Tax=Rhodococcus opacus TaxID=37919 RepID=UPI001469E5C3|nr:XdhC family protein [Rhodococcus opacus]
MNTVLRDIHTEWEAHRAVAVATVIATHGSSPRDPGAMLAVHQDGTVVGSISGGCVEGALYETALDVLTTGHPRIEHYGPTGDILEPGLTCGGSLTVLVERVDRETMPQLADLMEGTLRDETVILETVLTGPEAGTHRIANELDAPTGLTPSGTLIRRFQSRPRMVIVGSTDFAAETGIVGTRMGYRVTICDARPVFTTSQRFPDVDEVVCEWPSDWIISERNKGRFDSRTVIVVLTHDPKIDIPVLLECLDKTKWAQPLAYIGAMGSLTADTNRRQALTAGGLRPEHLTALSSPIGLDIGNRGPAETAISIAAEIIARRSAPMCSYKDDPHPGYPRISSADQDQNHQIDALFRAGVIASLHSYARAATGHDLSG